MNKRTKRILGILIMILVICSLSFLGGRKLREYRYLNSENSFLLDKFNINRNSIVQITIDTHTGSGLIWNIDSTNVIIVSNKHILENGLYATVYFESGNYYEAQVIKIENDYDIGFCKLEKKDLSKIDLNNMTNVSYYRGEEKWKQETLQGVEVCHVGVNTRRENDSKDFLISFLGEIKSYEFIPEFYEMMLVSKGDSRPGMSGGAVFNKNGILLGLLTGGYEGNTYSISTEDIISCAESLTY